MGGHSFDWNYFMNSLLHVLFIDPLPVFKFQFIIRWLIDRILDHCIIRPVTCWTEVTSTLWFLLFVTPPKELLDFFFRFLSQRRFKSLGSIATSGVVVFSCRIITERKFTTTREVRDLLVPMKVYGTLPKKNRSRTPIHLSLRWLGFNQN